MRGLILAVLGVLFIVVFSCSNEGGGFVDRLLRSGNSAVPVTVESVVVEEKAQEIKIPAELQALEATEITLPEDAVIDRIFVNEGSMVIAGDTLIKLSEQDLAQKITRLRSDLKDAKATFDKNTYFLKNRDRLFDEGKIDRTQFDNLESEVAQNEAAVEKLQQSITKYEERAGNTQITSPVAGMVGKISVLPGASISADKPVMLIKKVDPISVAFKLASGSARAVKTGMTVKLRILDLGGESALARITSVGSEIDPVTDSFPVKAVIANPAGHYKAGMRAEADFTGGDKQRFFLIPEGALIKERYAYFVYTVSNGVAHKVQVIPRDTVGNRVEISRGLNEADLVVVKGHDKLTEGTVVDIWGR